ncbi:MAG: phosphoglycerate kinase [Gammaproteobacteria bacterium]|nr:phosphoglycerate kinase [Gammaproteobacteria bacterium]
MSEKHDFITLDEVSLSGKRVLLRVDFNVPMENGNILDYTRIQASLPTIKQILSQNGRVIIMSHLGRPKEGKFEESCSLLPVAMALSTLIGENVKFISDWERVNDETTRRVILMENVRFQKGETGNAEDLSRLMASMCDIYVNDAFAAAHRSHASTHGVAKYASVVCAGPLMVREMDALTRAFKSPAHPLVAIVGGSKVSTKLEVLKSLLEKVDKLIVGGGIANTFLKATGTGIGKSLCEDELISTAIEIMDMAKTQGKDIPLPVDVVCGKTVDNRAEATVKALSEIADDDLILDIGPQTASNYQAELLNARTIIWNGPLGVFEIDQFAKGTEALARAIAESDAFSVAGGGDTLSAISKFNIGSDISYITTAGGAFLEFLEGKTLPAIAILEECALAWRATEREY